MRVLSEIDGRAPCYPAFPQLALIHGWHRDGVTGGPPDAPLLPAEGTPEKDGCRKHLLAASAALAGPDGPGLGFAAAVWRCVPTRRRVHLK
jgi:hypothetical protein